MTHSQWKKPTWMLLAVLLLLFIFISFYMDSKQLKQYPNYISESPSPTGVKAFYTFLQSELDSERWKHEPKLLPNKNNQLLIMVEPFFIPEKQDMEAYTDFIKAGNTILLLKSNPKGLFDLKTVPVNEGPSSILKVNDQDHASFQAEKNVYSRLVNDKGDEVLFYDDNGAIALKRSIGDGQLLVTVTPEWMQNGKILDLDHLPLLLMLIHESNASSVLFDEYIHSGKNAAAYAEAYPKWFVFLLLQGVFLLILWLWYKGKRFGPIVVPREESVRFSDEGIRAVAAWYLRGRQYHEAISIQADYVKVVMQERWGIPYSREWKELAHFLERKWQNMPTSEIRPYLNGLTSILQKDRLNKQEFLLWSRKLEQLRKEVEEG